MKRRIIGLWSATLLMQANIAAAQVSVGGIVDLVARNREADLTNRNFGGSSNLDELRARLFLDAPVDQNVQVFTQLLISGYGDLALVGAYIRFDEFAGSATGLQLGLIPSTVGNWGPRTYSDQNPLVGVPLVQNHHSAFVPDSPQTVDSLLVERDNRSQGGLPILYDNCWNTGIEWFGQAGEFDWSVAALSGSTTLPTRFRSKDIPQGTGRLAWHRGPAFVLGASGWIGPYLLDDMPGLETRDSSDYLNTGVGMDLAWMLRYVELHAEVYRAGWEHPMLPSLSAVSGYLEAKYKFRPRWHAAARLDAFEPGEIPDGSGGEMAWDYPVRRAEYGVGFRPSPRVMAKAVVQMNRFQGNDALDEDHYLMQVSARF
jgi:hypothetical protein